MTIPMIILTVNGNGPNLIVKLCDFIKTNYFRKFLIRIQIFPSNQNVNTLWSQTDHKLWMSHFQGKLHSTEEKRDNLIIDSEKV